MYEESEFPARVIDLPHRVPALTALGDDGEPVIFLNARLTEEQQRRAYLHEIEHIDRNDFFNSLPIEIIESKDRPEAQRLYAEQLLTEQLQFEQSQTKQTQTRQEQAQTKKQPDEQLPVEQQSARSESMNLPKAQDPEEVRIEISDELRMEAFRLFGLKPTDPRWDAILYAMLLTGCIEIRPTKQVTRTYYFPPVKVKKGAMHALGNETPRKMDEQRKFLYPFNKYI